MHDAIMSYFHKIRQDYPDSHYVTRSLTFPDGISRLVTLEKWYWDKLAMILEEGNKSEADILNYCWHIVTKYRKKTDQDFEEQLYKTFGYYIYKLYYMYGPYPVTNDNFREPASEETL